jgi:hypothetical protein
MEKTGKLFLILSLFCCTELEAANSNGPLQVRHYAPAFVERGSTFKLTFNVAGINPADVQDAFIFYRLNGALAFKQKRAMLYSSEFIVQMKIDEEQALKLEYYFEVHFNDGKKITYPASQEPIRVDVVDRRANEQERRVRQTGVDYTILSPAPESVVAQKDVIIALTLFYNPAEIDTANSSFQLLIDGMDVTRKAHASAYFYTYATSDLPVGKHTATFKMLKGDTALVITQWRFSVLNPAAISASNRNLSSESWISNGKLELSARNQRVGGYANDALSGNFRISGQKGTISYSGYGLLTSQEDPRLQPQNRFGASLNIGNWFEFDAGHIYPVLSPLTIAGQRVKGLSAALYLWNHTVNFKFIYGRLQRGIGNIYQFVEPEYQIFDGVAVDTAYVLDIQDSGTFRRDVLGARLGLGRGNNFELGLNFLKVEDDTNSVNIIDDYSSLMSVNPQLVSNLSETERQDLSNSGLLKVGENPVPKGNFVASSDLAFSFDKNRIRFQVDGAISLLNKDISEGILTQEDAEAMGLTLPEGAENLLERLSWLVILNENMNSLFFRFDENDGVQLIFPNGILATQSELGLNYLNNNLRIQYRWVGPNFNSLANTTIRKDIAGFSITDRVRLLQDRLYVTAAYEQLHDNVISHKDATTNTVTWRGNISWYPLNPDLPKVSIGLMNRNRDNNVSLFNPYLSEISPEFTVQNFINEAGEVVVAPTPRLSDTYQFTTSITQQFSLFKISHNLSLNYSRLQTNDHRFAFGGAESSNFSLWLINQFNDIPLRTNFGFNINNTKTGGGLTDISIVGFNMGGSMFFMDGKLNLDGNLAFTKNRSESVSLIINENNTPKSNDDFYQSGETESISESHSFIISLAGRYRFNNHHSLALDLHYSNVRNTIFPFSVPNDHLLQARYILNF